MALITEQQRIETYRNAPEIIRELYTSDALTEQVDKLHVSFDITVPFKQFSEVIGDTILGFNRIADLPRIFQQKLKLSADESQRLTSQLIDFLSPVVEREQLEANEKKESLASLTQTFSASASGTPVQQEAANETENVAPLRTMQGDINRIHGYGAYNESLQKRTDDEQDDPVVRSSQEHIFPEKK